MKNTTGIKSKNTQNLNLKEFTECSWKPDGAGFLVAKVLIRLLDCVRLWWYVQEGVKLN